jgi:predicted RecB family endonuclease
MAAGLPVALIPAFIEALSESDATALANVPGTTPIVIAKGTRALQQAYADSLRVVFIIAIPFGVLACMSCWFLEDLRETMNYHVDATVAELHAR